ncbi:methyl-accepting chemotaxis protein [uncultured Thiomicrorhabdus sp.]
MALQKISSKILGAMLLVGLVPMLVVALSATYNAKGALEEVTFKELEAVRDIKANAVSSYLQDIQNQLINVATNESVVDAMEGFGISFISYGGSEDGMDEGNPEEVIAQKQAVNDYWQNQFGAEYKKQNGQAANLSIDALSDQAIRLQYAFIADNPHPLGQKNDLDEIAHEGNYGYNKYHRALHPWLNAYLQRFGFYDIFLVDNDGNVVYSVFKELDYATNLETGPWKDSGLAEAYHKSLELKAGESVFTDLALYMPSYDAPAAFTATPIVKTMRSGREQRIGTLIFQMPLDRISKIMEQTSGLGTTGDSYLVGSDGLMRSDSRIRPDSHSVVNSFRSPQNGFIESASFQKALAGKIGEITIERDGETFLSAFAPIQLLGLNWVILAEMKTSEALASVTHLEILMLVLSLVMVLVIVVVGLLVARNISRPVTQLTEVMQQIKQSMNFRLRCDVQSQDEMGQAAKAFNDLLHDTEVAIREVNETMQHIADGDFSHRMRSDVKGDLMTLKNNVNATADSVQNTMSSLTQVMQAISEGDFSMRLGKEVKGDFRNAVNEAMGIMHSAVTEVGDAIQALSRGDLQKRVAVDLKGDLHDLKDHTNTSLNRLQIAIEAIMAAATAQSNGDLTVQITEEMHGDFESLKQAINQSTASLNQVVGQVVQTANTVLSASQEVSSGNNNLNHRTQSQAASLEETAAAMEELTSTIRHNSENALNADSLANAAMHQTKAGQEIMQQTESAIKQIHESSKQIEEITSLIDSIAFQTNLLALNAAVEAARAGEHGRGFAVVAGEVRSLAAKSADAAKEIKSLIDNTVASIEHGTDKISQTSDALEKINDSIVQVADRVSEISNASREQQEGVQQVNQAISQIDNDTQQNAALVEQTTAAADSMSQESQSLQNEVSRFKVREPLIESN